ncbi:MAG TPA: hypothetical protein ENJ82_11985 [Bacteroidetes bacterium]|nr:hypothetical protein [Bacteroidota bacterium]
MSNKNFDRVFYFTYSPGMKRNQIQAALDINFADIRKGYDIVDIKQSQMENKIVVTLFARER